MTHPSPSRCPRCKSDNPNVLFYECKQGEHKFHATLVTVAPDQREGMSPALSASQTQHFSSQTRLIERVLEFADDQQSWADRTPTIKESLAYKARAKDLRALVAAVRLKDEALVCAHYALTHPESNQQFAIDACCSALDGTGGGDRCDSCGGKRNQRRRITSGDCSYVCVDWFHGKPDPSPDASGLGAALAMDADYVGSHGYTDVAANLRRAAAEIEQNNGAIEERDRAYDKWNEWEERCKKTERAFREMTRQQGVQFKRAEQAEARLDRVKEIANDRTESIIKLGRDLTKAERERDELRGMLERYKSKGVLSLRDEQILCALAGASDE